MAAAAAPARRSTSRRVMRSARFQRVAYPLLAILVILVAWEVWVRATDVPAYLLPPVSEVIGQVVTQFGPLLPDTVMTLQEILLGFGMSVFIGIPLAVAIVASRHFEATVYPLLVISQVVPKVAIAPLIIVWAGFGMGSKVLISFLIAFFPVVIDTVVGLRSVELEKHYLARSMGATAIQTFFKIRLPQALPSIFSGLKLSATFAVIGAVVGEFVASDRGLGKVILSSSSTFDTALMFTAVTYLTVIGLVMFFAIDVAERLALPWHVSRRLEDMKAT